MKRTLTILGVAGLAVGCGAVQYAQGLVDAVFGTMGIEDIVAAYNGLVAAHGAPGSDAAALDLVQEATGLVFERREALRGVAAQVVDAAIGVAGLLGFQGIASGRGRQLIGAAFKAVLHRQPKTLLAAGMGLIAGAHSGKALGTAPPPPEGA